MKPGRKKRSRRDEQSRDAGDRQAQEIERLRQENERLREQLAEQAKRIADLERQLALRQQNSTTTSKPPPSDLTSQCGPPLTALIAYLTVVCRLPRLVVQRLLEGALQISISVGSTQNAWEEASAAVAAPYQELQEALPRQPVLNGDETG